jgi:hypothetical protein
MNNKDIYTFKIRKPGDPRKWEEIKPWLNNYPFTANEAARYLDHLADEEARGGEIRYSINGSTQGHYKKGQPLRRHNLII